MVAFGAALSASERWTGSVAAVAREGEGRFAVGLFCEAALRLPYATRPMKATSHTRIDFDHLDINHLPEQQRTDGKRPGLSRWHRPILGELLGNPWGGDKY
jgi:hypothetical protein